MGPGLCGVYLTGSAAVGAYRPGRSDLDVIVVVRDVDRARLEAVVDGCSHASLPCPARKLELVVYEADAVADPGGRPSWSLNLNTGENEQLVEFDASEEPAHWFVLDLAFAHRHAVALSGPPAASLIGDPGDATVRRALAEMVTWYERNEPDNAPVARARAEHWERTGEWASKAQIEG